MLAPVGVMSIVHHEAELAVARAARELGRPDGAQQRRVDHDGGRGHRARRLRALVPALLAHQQRPAASFVARAKDAGYSAIVVTLDTRLLAWRPRDLSRAYLPFLKGEGVANYLQRPGVPRRVSRSRRRTIPRAAIGLWATLFSNPGLTWDDLAFLQAHTDLPIMLKGVLHPDDARQAVDAGRGRADRLQPRRPPGGRLDRRASRRCPSVVDAVPDDCPCCSTAASAPAPTCVKALALGARAVLVGRPYVWGLGARRRARA